MHHCQVKSWKIGEKLQEFEQFNVNSNYTLIKLSTPFSTSPSSFSKIPDNFVFLDCPFSFHLGEVSPFNGLFSTTLLASLLKFCTSTCETSEIYHCFHSHLQLQSLLHSPEGLNKWWVNLAGLLSEEQSDDALSVHSPGHLQAAVKTQEGICLKMFSRAMSQ